MTEGEQRKTHWLIEGLGGVNIIVVFGAFIAASWYVFEIRAAQAYLTEKLEHLEVQIEKLNDRNTEIAQLGWRLEGLQASQNRFDVHLENLQKTSREIQDFMRTHQGQMHGVP